MNISSWSVWVALGLAVFQALCLGPAIRRLRESDSATRLKARLDLLEVIGSLLLFSGPPLSLVVAQSWVWLILSLAGFVLLTAVYAVKGVYRLRARRHPTA
ncbi:hypothetical protein [Streptomyces canus]|uniref:hypothetical protein n=1 Tax=Streptomyces canus TaxID=58343 RepID=UPI002E2F1B27|nr:hypothetical protein [Streptomyces canus]